MHRFWPACPGRGLIRLGGQPRYPGREPGWRVDLIGRQQPETILVQARSPLGMRLEPGSMQTCGGHHQVGYTGILSIQIAYEHGSRYFLDLGVPAFPQATDLRENPKYRHRQLGEVVWRYGHGWIG